MDTNTTLAYKVIQEVQKAVIGKDKCIEKIMMAILSNGHILLEDVPGVGKTTMALAFAKAAKFKRKSFNLYTGCSSC